MDVRVLADHRIPQRAPLRIAAGDRVRVGERSDEWPAFVFVTCERGEGWVPERHLDRNRPVATVAEPYDTQELTVAAGDVVAVVDSDDLSGWSWCRNSDGDEGWVPHAVLELSQ